MIFNKVRLIASAVLCMVATAVAPNMAHGADAVCAATYNPHSAGDCRQMQYYPDESGFIVSHNGRNLYTRALYGSNTLWRLETSDMPIFAAYHKKDNRNIHFTVTVEGTDYRLDSVADCTSAYKCGLRSYILKDPAWKDGTLAITVLAMPDTEGAVWRIETTNMPKDATLTARCCATVDVKLNRSGDLGADPDNCFAPHPGYADLRTCTVKIGGKKSEKYIGYADRDVFASPQGQLKKDFKKAMDAQRKMSETIVINTPDPYINTLAESLSAAADGIWDGTTYQHGAVGWRMPLSGWRGAYTGDFLGNHDRARTHFDAYATSQVVDVPPVISHPSQDTTMCLARAEKKWGTQMYSNGYICRNPGKNNVMHHYDMNLCYIDELLWHLQWTGDSVYARKMWPVIKSSLEWEKRNFDPDDDGLYDAYCCIWASDALYYNSGAVTHSSAYNYRANRLAARVAAIAGEDPNPYEREADKIHAAMNARLWMPDRGVWAEFQDAMGAKALHRHPGLWTIYHAIDSDVATPEQAWRATRYIDENIPHIPIVCDSEDCNDLYTLSTTDWLPYAWSINNVAFAEVYNTALAYWQAGRGDDATRLLKGAVMDGMFLGRSPGNIGQISYYDAARGECYRDFADPVGVLSRALVQGLFGFTPRLLEGRVDIRPGFPSDWEHASVSHPDFEMEYTMTKPDLSGIYSSNPIEKFRAYKVRLKGDMATRADTIMLEIPCEDTSPLVMVEYIPIDPKEYTIRGAGTPFAMLQIPIIAEDGEFDVMVGTHYPMTDDAGAPEECRRYADMPAQLCTDMIVGEECIPVDMSTVRNARVTDIFRNRYESPRSPYTTLQLPVQGIGEWCHPKDTANIDDRALRAAGGMLRIADGITFETPETGHNIVYTSLYDNYPDSVTIPLSGQARAINLLMAGSTNHMQCYMVNGEIRVEYADGSYDTFSLVPPYNWAPIEQDYYIDGKAFDVPTQRPLRVTLRDGICSRDLGSALGLSGSYDRRIHGGAATVLCLSLDSTKPLKSMTLKTIANEVVIGILSASYVR